jgi:integrase
VRIVGEWIDVGITMTTNATRRLTARHMRSGFGGVPCNADALANTPLKTALEYYLANRNCAPVSKRCLASTLSANVPDWMNHPLLGIDAIMLQERYRAVIARVKVQAEVLEARYAKLPALERLLRAPPGYFNGIKAANDTVRGVGRLRRYWIAKHAGQLHQAGILPPPCPTLALMDDMIPEAQRVRSIPWDDLRKLFDSFETYKGNPLHPLLVKLLLATGRRVGALISCRKDCIQSGPAGQIVIPADSERTKVSWRKRHLPHLAHIIPITPEIAEILSEIDRVGLLYGDAGTWLFPSRYAKSGHMQEERSVVNGLRAHAAIRFNLHRLRHNFGTAAEELGYSKGEIAELLGHSTQTVTDRYIDERTKRHRRQLVEVSAKIRELMGDCSAGDPRPATSCSTTATTPSSPSSLRVDEPRLRGP